MTKEKIKIPASTVEYLHQLRKTGRVNMMGAAPYLIRDLNIDKAQAREITMAYVFDNFEETE